MNRDVKQVKLAIVDNHNLFRKGLIKLINLGDKNNRYVVLFEAESGNDLQKKLDPANLPDIVLMDIDMPGMDGFAAVDWLGKCYPKVMVLVISMLETEEAVIRMIRMGVRGYLSKDIEVEDMHMALEAIINKGLYYSAFVSDIMAAVTALQPGQAGNSNGNEPGHVELSQTERELMKHVCTELTYSQIADLMHVSPKTVDGYRDALFRKLNVKSRVSLAMYAVKSGIVKL